MPPSPRTSGAACPTSSIPPGRHTAMSRRAAARHERSAKAAVVRMSWDRGQRSGMSVTFTASPGRLAIDVIAAAWPGRAAARLSEFGCSTPGHSGAHAIVLPDSDMQTGAGPELLRSATAAPAPPGLRPCEPSSAAAESERGRVPGAAASVLVAPPAGVCRLRQTGLCFGAVKVDRSPSLHACEGA
jgi:hypothetical protein